MPNSREDQFNVDDFLRDLFKPRKETLKELFDRRISELEVSHTNAAEILKMEPRTLTGILLGTQKRVDYTNLFKLADFLQVSREEVVLSYTELLEKNFSVEVGITPDRIDFIKKNFDLSALKKAGFIDDITDFESIEKKLLISLGLKSISDYRPLTEENAYSAGMLIPKNDLTRSLWKGVALEFFEELSNPYEYNRSALINYFPEIRWHSTNVNLGFTNVIRDLYRIGVTVLYQPSLSQLHLKGWTVSVNNKPCIVISDYYGFYTTLWFSLIHELFHVLFDWDEIFLGKYHISEDGIDNLTLLEKEKEADSFAREYLFSKDKTDQVRPFLKNTDYVKEFAQNNHVHPSMIYVFNAKDRGNGNKLAWSMARKHNPTTEMKVMLKPITNAWENHKSAREFIKSLPQNQYK